MTPAQKGLIEKLDGIIEALANVTTLLEASFDTHPELPLDDRSPLGFPDGLLAKLPPLPEPPEGMRWKYAGHGDDFDVVKRDPVPNIWAFEQSEHWQSSYQLTPLVSGHYAVAVPVK